MKCQKKNYPLTALVNKIVLKFIYSVDGASLHDAHDAGRLSWPLLLGVQRSTSFRIRLSGPFMRGASSIPESSSNLGHTHFNQLHRLLSDYQFRS